jgi:SAM-dependent methyltransferase
MAVAHCSRRSPPLLVDFGCGGKPYEPLFAPLVERYLGVDNPALEPDLPLADDGTVDLPDGSAGIVLSTQVLEHVPDPRMYLRECHRLLADGGLLLLSTHGVWPYHPTPADYWRWTGDGLARLVSEWFTVIEVRGVVGLAAAGLQLTQDGILRRVHWRLQPLLVPLFQLGMAALDRLDTPAARLRDASVYVVAAEKGRGARGR